MIKIINKNGESRIYKSTTKRIIRPYVATKRIKKLDFGVVNTFTDRGFGFISHTFCKHSSKNVFFHINTIKKVSPKLADNLKNTNSIKSIFFWYEFEETEKGEQVVNLLESPNILDKYKDDLPIFIQKIKEIWKDMNFPLPIWIHDMTSILLENKQVIELHLERDKLEKEQEAQEKAEALAWQKLIDEERIQEEIEKKEFEQLVSEMKSLGITKSKEVSRYIINNKLGHKYKNISGIIKMEQDGNLWNFKGGFPPNIYAKLCKELGLTNQGTLARAVDFIPFKDL